MSTRDCLPFCCIFPDKESNPGGAKASVVSAILQQFFQYCTATQSRHVMYDDPQKANDRLVTISPPPASFFQGALAPTPTVKPWPMKGVWLPSPLAADSPDVQEEKVVLHFPGGAFVIAFGHESGGRPASDFLIKHLHATKFLWAQYRLAADEATRFPAAIQDAVTYYRHVLSLGVRPENIILTGDSAGGNVVVALLRYLESGQAPDLARPGGAIVFSPWVHVTRQAQQDYDACSNTAADMLTGGLLQWGADSYLPSHPSNSADAYISPLHHPFTTSVPLYIHAGAAEAFHGSIKAFASEMEQQAGNRVRYHATPKAPHDILLSHAAFGLTQEFRATLDEMHAFFSEGK